MIEDTATPETGPVDAPAVSDPMDEVLKELETGTPPTDAIEEVVAELTSEDQGQAAAPPEAEEPTDEAEEAEEATQEETEEAPEPTDDPIHKVADERRALDAAKATVEADVKRQYANDLEQRVNELEALDPVLSEARQIDWDRLKAEDPATFVQYSDAVQQRLTKIEQYRAEVARLKEEETSKSQQQLQAEREQRLNAAAEKLVETMPELKEGDNFSKFASDNIGYLRELGFAPDEISDALDERSLILADKARKWDALQRAKQGLPAKKVVPKSSVKPMTTDAADQTRSSRTRWPKNRDARVDAVIAELTKG
jgi:hypothetical protein